MVAVTETTNKASSSNTANTGNRHNDEDDYSSNQYHQYPDNVNDDIASKVNKCCVSPWRKYLPLLLL
jgi:hypothetical protein